MISLIATTLNEADSILDFLKSLENQRKLDEVIIADGGSDDGTVEIIKVFNLKAKTPIRLIKEKDINIAEGRNLAISKAKGEIIATTDAGCVIDEKWLEEITSPFYKNKKIRAVSGFFKPFPKTILEKYIAAVTIPVLKYIQGDKFLPSSRSVAFKKSVWKKVGGYPEWLPICEDLVFDVKIRKKGIKFYFTPQAIVYWRPRRTIARFFKQYYYYARGDGHAKLWAYRHLIRYMAYFSLILGVLFSYYFHIGVILIIIPLGIIYLIKFYLRFIMHFPHENIFTYLGAILSLPFILFIGDLAKMIGYPVGILQRLTGKIRYEAF